VTYPSPPFACRLPFLALRLCPVFSVPFFMRFVAWEGRGREGGRRKEEGHAFARNQTSTKGRGRGFLLPSSSHTPPAQLRRGCECGNTK
jgi:hypothetical protein